MLNRTDVGIWSGVMAVLLVGGAMLLMRGSDANLFRVMLYLLAILSPFAFLWMFSRDEKNWRAYVGTAPEVFILLLSGILGLLLWLIVWWAMDFLNNELVEAIGRYIPDSPGENAWGVEVIQATVIFPLALSLLVFGLMRTRLAHLRRPVTALLMAFFLAVLATLIAPAVSQNAPTGVVGFMGYFVIGLAAALVSLHTNSMWTGFALYATFMYASLAFLFELLEQQIGVDYLDTEWLVPVILCAFGVVVVSQIIRVRAKAAPTTPGVFPSLSGLGWAGMLVLLMVWLAVAIDELDERNEEGSQMPENVITDEGQ